MDDAPAMLFDGPADAARLLLQALPVVASVEKGQRNRLFVRPKGGAQILNDVGVAMRTHDIAIEEIHLARGHLDQVFRSITTVQ